MKKTSSYDYMCIIERLHQIIGDDIMDYSRSSGIRYESIRNWLKGNYLPNIEQLIKLHNMGVDINWLITGIRKPNQINYV